MAKITRRDSYDVVIVGGGCTALMCALRAQQFGAKVAVLEAAPKEHRGGNGFFTSGAYRIVHNGIGDFDALVPQMSERERTAKLKPYTYNDFYAEYDHACEGLVAPELMDLIVSNSYGAVKWMAQELGIRFEMLAANIVEQDGQLQYVGEVTLMVDGAGAGLSDKLFAMIESNADIDLYYGTPAEALLQDDNGEICGIKARQNGVTGDIRAKAVILACGGFESNPEWRTRYLGQGWDLAKVRGSRYNMGDGIRMALDVGAKPKGNWSGAHAIYIDAEAPQPALREEGESTSKRQFVHGITVNMHGKRFSDEGEDRLDYTYSRYGQYALQQPHRIAFQIFDNRAYKVGLKSRAHDMRVGTHVEANTIEQLADYAGIDAQALRQTIDEYNADIRDADHLPYYKFYGEARDKAAPNITPPKSGNAIPIVEPPFHAFPVTCGITFTYGGVETNLRGQVIHKCGEPIKGLYAAGSTIGGMFYRNYPGGTGLPAGAVFAKICGENAINDQR